MRIKNLILMAAVWIVSSGAAYAAPGPNAEVVHVRQDCAGYGSDCFDGPNAITDASTWTNLTRQPDSSAPLVWQIGPGQFVGTIDCEENSHISYRGAGQGITRIVGDSASDGFPAFNSLRCDNLSIQDITLYSEGDWTIFWRQGGSSNWVNVEAINEASIAKLGRLPTGANAFYDECGLEGTEPAPRGRHNIWSSRLVSRTGEASGFLGFAAALNVVCGEAWVYGTDVVRIINGTIIPVGAAINVSAYPGQPHNGSVKVFGSSIRTVVDTAVPSTFVFGVTVSKGADFHAHGGIINVGHGPSGSGTLSVTGIRATDDAFVHTPDMAFNLRPSGSDGTLARLDTSGNAKASSPFLWEAGSTPPVFGTEESGTTSGGTPQPKFVSASGEDVFVEIDCDGTGNCNPATNNGASEPHLMIYSADHCGGANPWFDSVTGSCRQ